MLGAATAANKPTAAFRENCMVCLRVREAASILAWQLSGLHAEVPMTP